MRCLLMVTELHADTSVASIVMHVNSQYSFILTDQMILDSQLDTFSLLLIGIMKETRIWNVVFHSNLHYMQNNMKNI